VYVCVCGVITYVSNSISSIYCGSVVDF